MSAGATAFFLESTEGDGQRYCLYRAHRTSACQGIVVYLHPFAEEMNKSRRMAALQSAALADAGFAVLQIDLHGCGDSSGDFGDASWDGWVADGLAASAWLRRQHPGATLWWWGLRSGCLVAAEAARRSAEPCNVLFWQPSIDGASVLRHFLRLQVVGDILDGRARNAVKALRTQLTERQTVAVAGYLLAPELAEGLENSRLRPLATALRMVWLEVSSAAHARMAPTSIAMVDAWIEAGCRGEAAIVGGPAFWQTSEIEEAPQLISATLRHLLARPS
jgi:exosortase A-associated hydrolase 2